jgi:hypothetical protein
LASTRNASLCVRRAGKPIASPSSRAPSSDTIGTRDVIIILPLIVSRSSFALLRAASLTLATGPPQRCFGVGAIAASHCNSADAPVISFAAALLLPDYTNRDISQEYNRPEGLTVRL